MISKLSAKYQFCAIRTADTRDGKLTTLGVYPWVVHELSIVCPSFIPALVERTFVRSSFMKICVPFSLRAFLMTATLVLWLVKRTMTSRGVSFSSLFRPTRCDRTKSCFVSWTSSFLAATSLTRPSVSSFRASGMPRIRTVFRREYCSRSSVFSSKPVTLTFNSRISASFFAMMLPKDFVSV